MHKRSWSAVAGVLLLGLAIAPFLTAQVPTGVIDGKVTDASGGVLPGVVVEISGPSLMGTRVATAGSTGTFRFAAVPRGVYTVTFELAGFATLRREGIIVELNKNTTLNVTMELATVAETVTVTGESPVVDVKSTNVGVNVKEEMLQDVPNARDVWVVLEEIPGMVMSKFNVGGSESGQQSRFSAGGGPSQNAYNYDGIDITDMAATGAATYFAYDAFAEVQVSTHAHKAEVAAPGVFLNIVTRSGSNTLHGLQSFYYESPKLQGDNITPALEEQGISEGDKLKSYKDFSLALGGPFMKDKLWFYVTHQQQRPERYPLGYYLEDGSQGVDKTHLKHSIFKLDWQVNASNKIAFNWFYSIKYRPFRTGASYPYSGPGTLRKQHSQKHIPQLHWTSLFGDKGLFDLSYGRMDMNFPLAPDDNNKGGVSMYEYKTTLRTDTPPLPNWRRGYHQSYYRYNKYLRLRDQVNATFSYYQEDWLGGNHDFKFGLNTYWFRSDTTEYSLGIDGMRLGFRYGLPYNIRVENHPQRFLYNMASTGFYAQDTLTIGDKLTLNLGLRGDTYETYLPKQSREDTPLCPALGDRYSQFCAASFPEQRNIVDWLNFAPRLGLIYDVTGDGKTAIKANFGRYYNQLGNWVANFVNPNGYIYMYFRWKDANGDNMWQAGEEADSPYSGPYMPAANVVDPNLRQPYTDEWYFGINREVMEDLALAVDLVFRKDKDLVEDMANTIPFDAYTARTFADPGPDGVTGTGDDGTFTAFDMLPQYVGQPEGWIMTNPGEVFGQKFENSYKSLTFKVTKRMSHRWRMLAAYTWSRTLGWRTDAGDQASGFGDNPNSSINRYGRIFYDRPHLLKLSTSARLPYGINFGAFFRLQSGEPYERQVETPVELNQGYPTVYAEPVGSYRLPTVKTLDLRTSWSTPVNLGRIELMFDIFNLFNSNVTVDTGTLAADNFGDILKILQPRIARFGIKWQF